MVRNYDTIYNERGVVSSVSLCSEEYLMATAKERQIARDKKVDENGNKLSVILEKLEKLGDLIESLKDKKGKK